MNNHGHEEDLRELTPQERAYIERLLTVAFPGREEIREQARLVLARRIDDEGSLELVPKDGLPANVVRRIPVEGESADIDGVPIYFLLHVVDSQISELEIYKADGSPIQRMPPPEAVDVVASA